MAFGDVRGTLTNAAASITNPFNATGSVAVSVGDLVIALLVQLNNLTVTGVTDNLGHTFTDQNAGSDGGAVTARMFYLRVTSSGTMTSISAACTASTDNVTFPCAVFEGPFAVSPLDASPANGTTDVTSPFTCPASGTLSQADELVIGWLGKNSSAAVNATSPNLMAIHETGVSPSGAIGYQVVASTSSVSPEYTAGLAPTNIVLGTASFKKEAAAGQPYAKRMGGVGFVQDFRRGQNTNLWRKMHQVLLPPSLIRV